ncbi:MAG: 8-amino-7-oxononanoate synthase [Akkermansiaceae bacterium]|jgi:8-amino-7-oxononanoate synthase|nr:8-amino-7-oxononanoate synthase [Akkermansiaceae bacterium]
MRSPRSELEAITAAGLHRRLRTLESATGPKVLREGRELWNFASNDYLGLASHPAIRAAFHEGLDLWGHGAAASRLITGTLPPHEALEETIAKAKGTDAALSFSSGHAAATGSIPAIVGSGDHVVIDKLAHACLIDGARLSGASLRVFPHNDVEKLSRLLSRIRGVSPASRILVITESVFSMDGDLAPLREIVETCEQHEALLLVDEAHGLGVFGPGGMGLAEEMGLQSRIDFHMGTLGKAAGLAGAYIACSADWRELLINRARSFIFSTAPPPALAHAARAAIDLLRSPQGTALRSQLRERMDRLRPGHSSPIFPWILGTNEAALEASASLENQGFLVPAIRYPTVPRGTARLRISLGATHPLEAIDALRVLLENPPPATRPSEAR